jgi:RNA polymerase sigma-70 factor (ECF subfamily)
MKQQRKIGVACIAASRMGKCNGHRRIYSGVQAYRAIGTHILSISLGGAALNDSASDRLEAENRRAAELVRQVADGRRQSEGELILMYDRRLLVKLRTKTSDPDRVQELRQEVWMRVIEVARRGGVRQPERFYGFLLGIARNVLLEDFKKRKADVVSLDAVATIRDTAAGVASVLDRRLIASTLRRLIGQLSERDREIIVRHYVREDPKEVTCELLGLTSLNYNNVLYRARRRLAGLLRGVEGMSEQSDGESE